MTNFTIKTYTPTGRLTEKKVAFNLLTGGDFTLKCRNKELENEIAEFLEWYDMPLEEMREETIVDEIVRKFECIE